jgi:hypothetical protein
MNAMERNLLDNVAETYGVTLPEWFVEAKTFATASTKYRVEVEAVVPPTLAGVTAKTFAKRIDAILAAAQHDERLRLAAEVERTAGGLLVAAYARFAGVLLTELAEPFNAAAEAFMAAYDSNATPTPEVVATLGELVRVRDVMANRVGDATPTYPAADLPTRCATLPHLTVLAVALPKATHALTRGSVEWCNAMLGVDGVRLKWLSPAAQSAHVASLPHAAPVKV